MPVLEQVLEQNPDTVKVVFKNYPLRSHSYAYQAATAVTAAHTQGKFWEFHDRLFQNYNQLNDQKVEQIAAELGLDTNAFNQARQSAAVNEMIRQDVQDAVAADVRGTPTVFVNGRLLKQRDPNGFQMAIDGALKELGVQR